MAVGEPVQEPEGFLSFEPRDGGRGLSIIDTIERRHFTIETPNPVFPHEASTELFDYPVTRAVAIETDRLFIPQQLGVMVRNSMGLLVAEISKDEQRTFPADRYSLDPGAPVKTYLSFDAGFSVDISAAGIDIELDTETTVHVGARSHHKRPAATITTTDHPDDLRTAISYFSSALKTTTCERSYPTLRGHPPAIEMGETLDIPSRLRRKDTGVAIAIPDDYRAVFASATLAYYLGAELVAADRPRLMTDTGFNHPLDDSPRGLEGEIERTLKQVFFLDCLTRTEGLYRVNLHERNQVEERIRLDFAELYDQPIAAQLEAYLEVPYHVVEPHLPDWKLTAHVTPDPAHAVALPFLVNDLAVIKAPPADVADESGTQSSPRGTRGGLTLATSGPTTSVTDSAPVPALVRIEEAESIEQTWLGEGAPMGASKAMPEAFHNRLGRSPADHDIDITVVCNATEMGNERELVNDVYGSRDELPFDLSVHTELTTRELRVVLGRDTDYLHYIGHIDGGGFECADGRLDAASIRETGVDVFFLNGCTSYEQGMRLIEAGSIAGIVTLHDVINSGAERVGMSLARLLNCGFPLRAAMAIAKGQSIMGSHYLVIGDGGIEIAQSEGGAPVLCELEELGDRWQLRYISYPTHEMGMGAITTPFIDTCDEIFLTSGHNGTFQLTHDKLREFLALEEMPLRLGGELTWSSEFLAREA